MKFLYTFVILILLFNCDRKQTVEPTESEIIQTEIEKGFLEYWFFPKGSYWVYQLNGWEVFDTVRVTSSSVLYREKSMSFIKKQRNYPTLLTNFTRAIAKLFCESIGERAEGIIAYIPSYFLNCKPLVAQQVMCFFQTLVLKVSKYR